MEGKKALVKKIALERINVLFDNAEKRAGSDLSVKYVKTLRRMSAHYKVSIPKKMKDRICTHCNLVLVPGQNAKVRIASSHKYIVYICDKCGNEKHIYYK